MITYNFENKTFSLFANNQLVLYIDKFLYSDRYTLIDYTIPREVQFYPENLRYRIFGY